MTAHRDERRCRVRIVSGGRERRAVVHRPPTTAPDEPLPLVLTLHGSGSGALDQLRVSGLQGAADRHRFMLVAPQGVVPDGPGYAWAVPGTGTGHLPGTTEDAASEAVPDDARFLDDLIGSLVSDGQADPRRVYAAGISGGARMACHLVADRPGRVAALVAVAGLRAGDPSPADPRVPDRATFAPPVPTPVLAFHGTADPVNPFAGGGPSYWGYGVRTALVRWAEVNRCRPDPTETPVGRHVTLVSHAPGPQGADTVLYVVHGGGHTWPGSPASLPARLGPVTDEIDANEVLWRFVRDRITPGQGEAIGAVRG